MKWEWELGSFREAVSCQLLQALTFAGGLSTGPCAVGEAHPFCRAKKLISHRAAEVHFTAYPKVTLISAAVGWCAWVTACPWGITWRDKEQRLRRGEGHSNYTVNFHVPIVNDIIYWRYIYIYFFFCGKYRFNFSFPVPSISLSIPSPWKLHNFGGKTTKKHF